MQAGRSGGSSTPTENFYSYGEPSKTSHAKLAAQTSYPSSTNTQSTSRASVSYPASSIYTSEARSVSLQPALSSISPYSDNAKLQRKVNAGYLVPRKPYKKMTPGYNANFSPARQSGTSISQRGPDRGGDVTVYGVYNDGPYRNPELGIIHTKERTRRDGTIVNENYRLYPGSRTDPKILDHWLLGAEHPSAQKD